MKKIIPAFVLCLILAGPAFAQNNMEAMKFLTVNALMQYGQKLYDRGDFNEATYVFNHVLTFDAHQAQALQYLKEMGHSPVSDKINFDMVLRLHGEDNGHHVIPQAQLSKPIVAVPSILDLNKADEQIVNSVDVSDTASLKRAIEAKKRVVENLKAQIMQMQANMASQSAGE